MEWSDGRAIVATGSPFPDVVRDGQVHHVGQGNNAFIFPGLGFGAILAECREITDGMVLEAAYALADYTTAAHLQAGRIYPPVRELHEVSIRVAARVIEQALREGVAGKTDLAGTRSRHLSAVAVLETPLSTHRARRPYRDDRPSRLSQGEMRTANGASQDSTNRSRSIPSSAASGG